MDELRKYAILLPERFSPHADFSKWATSQARHGNAPSRVQSKMPTASWEKLMDGDRQNDADIPIILAAWFGPKNPKRPRSSCTPPQPRGSS